MSTQTFVLENLSENSVIKIGANGINFHEHSTLVYVYYEDNLLIPVMTFFAELYMAQLNQTLKDQFSFNINSKKVTIVIDSDTLPFENVWCVHF